MKKAVLVLIGMLLLLSACTKEENTVPDVTEVIDSSISVYLIDQESGSLAAYPVISEKDDTAGQIASVIKVLKTGVAEEGYEPTITSELQLESINLDGRSVILYIGESVMLMDELDFSLCRSSIIKSITGIEGVDSVEFYVDGYPMKDASGKVYGPFTSEDVVTTPMNMVMNASVSEVNLILYYPDEQGESLIRVDRKVTLSNNEPLEGRIIEELKTVPEGYGLSPVMPEESVLKSVRVSGGICYIDFNTEFRTKHYGGATGEIMTVYAIVNSLTELPNVSHVQFLIEGVKSDSFKGHLDFGMLFENDVNLINKDVQYVD